MHVFQAGWVMDVWALPGCRQPPVCVTPAMLAGAACLLLTWSVPTSGFNDRMFHGDPLLTGAPSWFLLMLSGPKVLKPTPGACTGCVEGKSACPAANSRVAW
jgi:hypothetical protein